ncbi:MAG: HEAT repeat domain-containing protein [Gemmatimonadaceae bacterium]|nr:HEAT repeat domain-containing protein [Gemmatimonadaceae bacterium]HMV69960.1 HEAT repeat domain-containing protein [Myxococcota bacterium]
MKLLTISICSALSAGALLAPVPAPAPTHDPRLPAASYAPRDTADSLWRRGRIAIAEEDWSRAAQTFRDLVDRYPRSAYAGDALYWEAFALQRSGRQASIRRAVESLERQKREYASAPTLTSGEAGVLLTRLKGKLAQTGDAVAAADLADMAEEIAGEVAGVSMEALRIAAEEMRRARPEIEAELAQVRPQMERELRSARRELERERRGLAVGGPDEDVPPGCEAFADDERVEAINALMQMNPEQATPILKKVLARRDKCAEVLRRKAVFILSQQRTDEAADILVDVARNDPDRTTRENAVFWLSQTDSPRAAVVLEQILRDSDDEEMQKRAIFSLAQSKSERSQEVLRAFVRRTDVDDEVRGDAIFWLGQSPNAENSAALRGLFGELQDDEAREKLLFALSQNRSEANQRFLLERAKDRSLDTELRKSALFWAGQSGVPIRDLGEIYDSAGEDRALREQVIFTLSQRRDAAAVEKLIDIARKEPDRDLRKNAIFWLSQSRDPRAAKFLEDLINK